MDSFRNINIKCTEKDVIAYAMRKIRDFWNIEKKPNVGRIDTTIKINGITHSMVMSAIDRKLNLIIQL